MKKIMIALIALLIPFPHITSKAGKIRVGKENPDFSEKSAIEQFRILRKKYGVPEDEKHKEGTAKQEEKESGDIDEARRELNLLLNKESLSSDDLTAINRHINDLENSLKNDGNSWPGAEDYRDLLRHTLSSGEAKEARSKGKDAEEKKNNNGAASKDDSKNKEEEKE